MKIEERMLTVKELPLDERPYEKCEKYGPGALSDSELIAVIIRSGKRGERSTDLARRIITMRQEANASVLNSVSIEELKEVPGVGRVKAVQLKCAAELGRRIAMGKGPEKIEACNSGALAEYYGIKMSHLEKENVILLCADGKGRIFDEEVISVGTVNSSLVSPREVFLTALSKKAVNIFLLHNHPSGDPTPSREDILITERVADAGRILGIKLLDHIIIGRCGAYVSLNETGTIKIGA